MSLKICRMPAIVSTRVLALFCLMGIAVAKPLWLEIVLFQLRGGMMRCSQPLRRSLLMDYVPKNARARWNAFEGISVFSWSGSAVLGGYLIDAYDYRTCFMITSCVYWAGLALELMRIPLTRHAIEKHLSKLVRRNGPQLLRFQRRMNESTCTYYRIMNDLSWPIYFSTACLVNGRRNSSSASPAKYTKLVMKKHVR